MKILPESTIVSANPKLKYLLKFLDGNKPIPQRFNELAAEDKIRRTRFTCILVIEPVGGSAVELRLRNYKICGLLSYIRHLSTTPFCHN